MPMKGKHSVSVSKSFLSGRKPPVIDFLVPLESIQIYSKLLMKST